MSLSPAKMDNTTSGEILSFLQTFKESIEKKMVETKVEIEATNRKLDGRLNNIEDEVRKVNDKIVNSDEISARMDTRLSVLETEMKNSMRIRRRSDELRSQQEVLQQDKNEKDVSEEFQVAGQEKNKKQMNKKVVDVTRDILEQPVGTFRSSWARGMQQELQSSRSTCPSSQTE